MSLDVKGLEERSKSFEVPQSIIAEPEVSDGKFFFQEVTECPSCPVQANIHFKMRSRDECLGRSRYQLSHGQSRLGKPM